MKKEINKKIIGVHSVREMHRYQIGKTELDIEQAISDMKKDELLHQYQFFVGEGSHQESFTGQTGM